MRLQIVRSTNAASYYVIKSTYINGKHSSKIVEKLGTEAEIRAKHPDMDPETWAREYIAELNRKEKEGKLEVIARFSNSKRIPSGKKVCLEGGYLFLQKIYHALGLHKICKEISKRHTFEYDLNDILSKLVYTRILEPASKKSSLEASRDFIEGPNFELHDLYRALEVLASESDFIQAEVYKNSKKIAGRNDKILYYDCTNYFFEMEEADGLKQYGYSKEHRPNPIVQMGLFLDGSGFPLAFSIHPGNKNEQETLLPLEKKLLGDFEMSKFIVCTDCGLSSMANRKFNDRKDRAFVVTQSVKKLKKHLKDWALDPKGWSLEGSEKTYDLREIDEQVPQEYHRLYYKRRWIKENDLEQQLLVTFSPKHKLYQRFIRERQVERAVKMLETPSRSKKKNPHDPKRFIENCAVTEEGEVLDKELFYLNEEAICQEEQYDGFYAVCTNLEASPAELIRVNKQRWQIEDAFRTMKTEFKARPVFLKRDDRILAHFLTCFLSLLIYKILEQKVAEADPKLEFSGRSMVETLRGMNFHLIEGEGYVPIYTRTAITDALHEASGFHTDFQILGLKDMKKVISKTKK